MTEFFSGQFIGLFESFTDPRKRVFVGYLFSAFLLSLLWYVLYQQKTMRQAYAELFKPKIWLSPSAKADYLIFIVNRLVLGLFSPYLLTQMAVAGAIYYQMVTKANTPVLFAGYLSDWQVALSFTFVFFVVDDFFRFFVHLLLHKIPVLWHFHKVHHSAEALTPITVFRTHPVEGLIFSLRGAIAQGSVIALFIFLFGNQVDLVTVFGANVFVFFFNIAGSNLRHSHVAIFYPRWLERWLMSPAQHHVHHSIEAQHWDKNFGVALSVWDRLFGTLHYSERRDLSFGLTEGAIQHSLFSLYVQPFVDLVSQIKQCLQDKILFKKEVIK